MNEKNEGRDPDKKVYGFELRLTCENQYGNRGYYHTIIEDKESGVLGNKGISEELVNKIIEFYEENLRDRNKKIIENENKSEEKYLLKSELREKNRLKRLKNNLDKIPEYYYLP